VSKLRVRAVVGWRTVAEVDANWKILIDNYYFAHGVLADKDALIEAVNRRYLGARDGTTE
jgi:hypothetical protein